ncbi:urokinase plasminogen activator surface receptor-like isoform X1 [Sinocyclocheilus rhinocerous]|uniref:urokinase plasminogen activator surface receptor-like isoform X1 n=1 Tax=Sinocyclocheilus rhinocerous TaxID=307959 RepID=UPI0007B9069A|nr:PREDICTED: urokinase plasminogen activator surface receptor-like isoform X1 [Sinocyclocheilus rhinocerous]
MDLQISVFLLFVLFTAGHSLSCYECTGLKGSCANQKVKTCPSRFSKCMSTTAVTQVGDIRAKVKAKDCAVDCASGSMNLGIIKRSSVCCNTDRCNIRDAPDPSIDSNGEKCYYCDGKNCSNTVSCSGSEDHCITSSASYGEQSLVVKGCVSKSICDSTTSDGDVQKILCCSGNLCNGAQSVTQSANSAKNVTQSFLFLCCSLLSFILLLH